MMHRRELVLGSLLTIVCGCGCAHGRVDAPGCITDDAAIRDLVGNAPLTFGFNVNTDPVESSSGDRDFDRALAISLSKLCDIFGVLPGFAFYDDSDQVRGNAFASSSQRLGRADGSVVFGKRLLHILLQQEQGAAAVIGVCAHEFGHIAQMKRRVRSNMVADGKVKRLELHADYLAGYFAGRRRLEKNDFPAAVIAETQWVGGDFNTWKPTHHGTPEERGQAVVEGYQAAYRDRKPFDRAFNDGMTFVTRFPL